jgi:hypothetical protein
MVIVVGNGNSCVAYLPPCVAQMFATMHVALLAAGASRPAPAPSLCYPALAVRSLIYAPHPAPRAPSAPNDGPLVGPGVLGPMGAPHPGARAHLTASTRQLPALTAAPPTARWSRRSRSPSGAPHTCGAPAPGCPPRATSSCSLQHHRPLVDPGGAGSPQGRPTAMCARLAALFTLTAAPPTAC